MTRLERKRVFACPAPGCGRIFPHYSRLQTHELSHVPHEERRFACDAGSCRQRFNSAQHLAAHRLAKHDAMTARRYLCDVCGAGFRKNALRSAHMAAEHDGQQAYRCNVEGCAASFALPSRLKKHAHRVHERCEQKFRCNRDECSDTFATHRELLRHIKIDHKPICLSCGRIFDTKQQLRDHETLHERPLESRKVHSCPHEGCPKRYTKLYALTTHIAVRHENARLFSCDQCGRQFAHKVSLRRHVSRAHGHHSPTPDPRESKSLSLLDQLVGRPPERRVTLCDNFGAARWSGTDLRQTAGNVCF